MASLHRQFGIFAALYGTFPDGNPQASPLGT
jgi:hypothetical protein